MESLPWNPRNSIPRCSSSIGCSSPTRQRQVHRKSSMHLLEFVLNQLIYETLIFKALRSGGERRDGIEFGCKPSRRLITILVQVIDCSIWCKKYDVHESFCFVHI
jgi:hypothetical protein